MINVMIEHHCVDRNRLIITGVSAGGAMTSAMLASYPEKFAGVLSSPGFRMVLPAACATLQLPSALHVNSTQTYEAAALADLGPIQAPLLEVDPYFESGALVEILPDFRRRALTASLVVAHRSNLSRRVRAFMKWLEEVLAPYLE